MDIRTAFDDAKRRWATGALLIAQSKVRHSLAIGEYGLHSRTGNLSSKVETSLLANFDGHKVGTAVTYGRGWELGFTRPETVILPKRVKALHFFYQGKEVFAKRAVLPEKTFTARPWLVPAMEATIPEQQKLADHEFQKAIDASFPDRKFTVGGGLTT